MTVQSDKDAIDLAFTKGESGTGEANRGEGLFDLYDRVRTKQGQLHAWSGNVRARTYGSSWHHDSLDVPYEGTIIYARWTPAATQRTR